ncbi:cytochrome P450 [Collybia nuda]|uniref:Cytochrome P450 n=1 Tax=Collybia nuda TaxID=64659 RepID=A0A9P6CFR8_9AGAR|nr:cytochrome P450 [Collybia nuda]
MDFSAIWSPSGFLITIFFSLLCLSQLRILWQRGSRDHTLPPGPSGYPFIGNLLQLTKVERPHLLFSEWNRKYGNIVHFSVFGSHLIIINTLPIANDLLEKRGSIYSDRPNMVLENEILGWDAAMPTMRYGAQFRKHRRLSQALLNPNAARGYAQVHKQVVATLLSSLSKCPDKFHDHILVYATSTIFKLAYDLDVKSENHHLVRLANNAVKGSAEAYQASGSIVDFFPSLKWLYTSWPDWAPFSGFTKAIARLRKEVLKANNIPYDMAKERIRSGVAQPSLVQNAIEVCGGIDGVSDEDEKDIRGLAGILYGAGQETTMATLNSFILAMVLFPEVQRKAHAEIDAVSRDKLPDLDDRPHLPYLEAFVKELYRWASPLIIAIPHVVMSDDYYNGYFIPRGTSVIANIYDMLNVCPRSLEFLPERFIDRIDLGEVPMDPREIVFGFGRRRCPGMHVADNSVWIAVAQMLTLFNFLPEIIDGKEIPPLHEFGIEMARHPKPFRCRIEPRAERADIKNI